MWYLHSLLFCYFVGTVVAIAVVNQAKRNKTPLTGEQVCFLGMTILILMSIPLLNIIYCVNFIYGLIFNPYEVENEINDLIDNLRSNIS